MRWQDFEVGPDHVAAYMRVASDVELAPSLAPCERWLFKHGSLGDSVHTCADFAELAGVPVAHVERIAHELLSELADGDAFDFGLLIILHADAKRAARSNQTPLRGIVLPLRDGPSLSRSRTFQAPPPAPVGRTG